MTTPMTFAADPVYAGFWLRVMAVVIDTLLSLPIYYGVTALLGDAGRWQAESLFIALVLAYYCVAYASPWQGTLGMRLAGFIVTDDHGARIGLGRAAFWCVTSMFGVGLCFAGVLYLQSKFDLDAIRQLIASCNEQNVATEDCIAEIESITHISYASFQMLSFGAIGMALFLSVIWALSIALAKDKTGFHNLLCRTRFVKGRPGKRHLAVGAPLL